MGLWRVIHLGSFTIKWNKLRNAEKIIKSVNQRDWFTLREVKVIQAPVHGSLSVITALLENNIKAVSTDQIPFDNEKLIRNVGELLSSRRVESGGKYTIPHAIKLFVLQKN